MLGVSEPEKFLRFEVPVKLKHVSFIDAFLLDTKVIIEQKSLSESLSQEKSQSDGTYVTCWFKKAADFIHDTKIACAFVATNSIGQGIAVPPLWTYLFKRGVVVNFVHRTFKWTSESADIAAVHCVIVGFAKKVIVLPQANPPREDVPLMIVGSCSTDGGNFLLTADKRDDLINRDPAAEKWIRRYVGSNNESLGELKNFLENERRNLSSANVRRAMEEEKIYREKVFRAGAISIGVCLLIA